jgi:hypothetical protein
MFGSICSYYVRYAKDAAARIMRYITALAAAIEETAEASSVAGILVGLMVAVTVLMASSAGTVDVGAADRCDRVLVAEAVIAVVTVFGV